MELQTILIGMIASLVIIGLVLGSKPMLAVGLAVVIPAAVVIGLL